jgi:hypothetical protein
MKNKTLPFISPSKETSEILGTNPLSSFLPLFVVSFLPNKLISHIRIDKHLGQIIHRVHQSAKIGMNGKRLPISPRLFAMHCPLFFVQENQMSN